MSRTSKLASSTLYLSKVLLLLLFASGDALSDETARFTIQPTPSWVQAVPAFDSALQSEADEGHGFHDRLNDLQINGVERGNTRTYNAVEYLLTSTFGVENFSDVEISFNPDFQKMVLHELTVKRGDELINRLYSVTLRPDAYSDELNGFDREGRQTVTLGLKDLRVGDTVRYAYTLSGEDAVYRGNREFHFNTELWTQLDRQYVRVLTRSDDPLNRRVRGDDVSLLVNDKMGVQEIIFDQRNVARFKTENGVPSWRETRGTVVLSDMENWQDVVEWSLPIYQLLDDSSKELIALADKIRAAYDGSNAQIGAALRWVQEEIEFHDVDLASSSALVSDPNVTLKQRFGDRRDKAVLLMALLDELNIESEAALVNTNRGLEANSYPFRLHAFNHVLVHVNIKGISHYIDPTRRGQSGALGELYEPNYGRALVLKPGTVDLSSMDDKRSAVRLAVNKELTLPADWAHFQRSSAKENTQDTTSAVLKVVSRKQGLLAEKERDSLETAGESSLSESYRDYYEVLFPSIAILDTLKHRENPANLSTSTESYSIENFWEYDDKVGDHRWLYADDIIGYLSLPKKTHDRKRPYELIHPVDITETWVVPVSANIRMHLEEAEVENEWLKFKKSSVLSEDDTLATITFSYTTLTNEVSARDLDLYAQSVEKITDHASFYLQNSPVMAAASKAVVIPWNTTKVKVWIVFIGLIYFTGWWLHFMKRYRRAAAYYDEQSD